MIIYNANDKYHKLETRPQGVEPWLVNVSDLFLIYRYSIKIP